MFGKKILINTDPDKIEEVLTRGVAEIIGEEKLRADLSSGRRLRIKLGIDPTSPNLHLGRSVPLLKMQDFQELGHQVVFIVGDFTGVIGDTSDKESERPMIEESVIEENKKTYFKQVGKLIDLGSAELKNNSEWLSKLTYKEIGEQANQFSVADFIARDNIKKRLSEGTRVSLREVLYPLMQGYDSVAVRADVELGGVDQRFNLLAGRTLQTYFKQPPQNIVTTTFPIVGLDGRKMSSSWGNTINITDEPNDMYGKVMSMSDDVVDDYFILCTRISTAEIEQMKKERNAKRFHPKEMKMRLAREIVTLYHGEDATMKAEGEFGKTFREGGTPKDIKEVRAKKGDMLDRILLDADIVASKNEFRRLVRDGGISVIDEGKITDDMYIVEKTIFVKVGKRRFLKIQVS